MYASEMNALLRELVYEVRGLRADLARQAGAPIPATSLADLVEAIASTAGDCVFTAVELEEFAEAAPPEKLQIALHAAGGTNPRRIGKLLRRLQKQEFPNWRVVEMGSDRDGILWKVVPASFIR